MAVDESSKVRTLGNRNLLSPASRTARRLFTCVAIVLLGPGSANIKTWSQDTPPIDGQPRVAADDGKGERGYRYWTTTWSFQEIDIRELASRLKSIGIALPVEIEGTASVNFVVSVPTNGLTNTRAYRFQGSLFARDLQVDEVKFREFSTKVKYAEGRLMLSDFKGRTESGTFFGSAEAEVNPLGPVHAELNVQRIDVAPIAHLIARFGPSDRLSAVSGSLDAKADISGDLTRINDRAAWSVSGTAGLKDFSMQGSTPFALSIGAFSMRGQKLHADRISVTSASHPKFFLNAGADLSLDSDRSFEISLQADDLPTADLIGLILPSPEKWIVGKLDLSGTAKGKLAANGATLSAFEAALSIASPELRVLGQNLGLLEHRLRLTPTEFAFEPLGALGAENRLTIESIRGRFEINDDRLAITQTNAKVWGGTFQGTAAFARNDSGVHRVAVEWNDLSPITRIPLPLTNQNATLTGRTTGSIRWSAPADSFHRPAAHRATGLIKISELTLGAENLGSVSANFLINESGFQLQGDGELIGGRVGLRSELLVDRSVGWGELSNLPLIGELSLVDVSLGRTIKAISKSSNPGFDGRFDGTTRFQISTDSPQSWESQLELRDLSVGRRMLSRRIRASISQLGSDLEIGSIDGDYAGGQIRARGKWSLETDARVIDASFVRMRGDQLLLPVHADADRWVGGLVSGRATISGIGTGPFDGFRVSGSVRVTDGQGFGMPIGDAHSPLRVHVNLAPLQWEASFPNVRSNLARGAVQGDIRLASSAASQAGFSLDSRWRVGHVDFENLLSTYVGTKTIGRGDVTGTLSLSGDNVQSISDLTGRYRFKLGGTDATAIPGLSTAGSTLGALSLTGVRFTDGEVHGRIASGAVTIEQLVLLGDRTKVQADGRIFLSGMRMDVRGEIATGNFEGQSFVRGLAPIALNTLTPLASVNRLLSDRIFVLDAVGTVKDPQIRILTAETVQANVRQRLVSEAVNLIIADSVLTND